MPERTDEIVNIVRRYINELEKNNIHITDAVLFGSYTNGNPHQYSDIDIALVSENFCGIRFLDRKNIADITLIIDHRISPLPFRPEEFNDNSLFVKEILTTGKRIL
ncbi:MAG: nucleotidyltransferase domain-containing protein [Candidatus Hydrogenedentota bacterium]